ncbi:MAG: hypothetical protein E7K05_02890 [Serratia marcescens]|nr:hypothetical protein [Serratia marcescens]
MQKLRAALRNSRRQSIKARAIRRNLDLFGLFIAGGDVKSAGFSRVNSHACGGRMAIRSLKSS